LVNGLILLQDKLILFKGRLKEMLRKGHTNSIRCGNQLIDLTTPVVMGIINATPDSFYQNSRVEGSIEMALEMAGKMLTEGATILDIGGASTRPGAAEIPVEEELNRVLPIIQAIHSTYPEVILSVDTYRAEVARQCIHAGVTMVNDISGGELDHDLCNVVAELKAAYVLMHMRGTPSTMNQLTEYQYITHDLLKYFINKIRSLLATGIEEVVIDPGFGFAKTMEQNYQLIGQLDVFRILERPVMVGISRKSTLTKTIGRSVDETLEATTALHMVALQNRASILRVHDVRAAMDTIAVYNTLQLSQH
jgi:dihydropteroate synthase